MNVAVIGLGQLGKEVVSILKEKNINVVSIIDPYANGANYTTINEKSLENVDVCVDTSIPDTVVNNIEGYIKFNKNCVIATTGWYEHKELIRKKVVDANIGLVYSPNFSIGANLFFRIIDFTSKLFSDNELYDVFGQEIHHKLKKDSPSGTAGLIGQILLKNMHSKDKLIYETLDRRIEKNEINITSVRGGHVPGTHKVFFDSEYDTVELTHTLRNRKSLAQGVVVATEWILGKKGFYNIDDMIDAMIKG